MSNFNQINYIYTKIIYYKILLFNIQWLRFLLIYKIRINFRGFCKIPLQMKEKILYYIYYPMKIMLIFLQIFLDFQKNSLVKLTKLQISKKIKKIKKVVDKQ